MAWTPLEVAVATTRPPGEAVAVLDLVVVSTACSTDAGLTLSLPPPRASMPSPSLRPARAPSWRDLERLPRADRWRGR